MAAPRQAAPGRTIGGKPLVQFKGRPTFDKGQAVLIEKTIERATTLSQITAQLDAKPAPLDSELALWVYVQDLAMPRARIRLADLLRLGGRRPLNLSVRAGERIRVVLVDPKGVWAAKSPQIEVQIAG